MTAPGSQTVPGASSALLASFLKCAVSFDALGFVTVFASFATARKREGVPACFRGSQQQKISLGRYRFWRPLQVLGKPAGGNLLRAAWPPNSRRQHRHCGQRWAGYRGRRNSELGPAKNTSTQRRPDLAQSLAQQQRLRPQGQLHEDSADLPRPLLCSQRPRNVRPAYPPA